MTGQDSRLLGEFNAKRSEAAFAALVRQHIDLVFATALRQVGDPGIAEEVAQNVFMALAQSAGKLQKHPTIAGWLHQTTLNKARERLRCDLRRHKREHVASNLELARTEGDSVWAPVVPLLDEALLELRESDRAAIILHFMEGRTFREVGAALGVGEDAARKRVHNCLNQLTNFFRRHGFAVPALAAGAPLFALSSHAAPSGLVLSATAAGLAAANIAGTSALTFYTVMVSMQKTLIVGAVVVAVVAGVYEAQRASNLHQQVEALQQQQAPLAEQNQQLQNERDENERQVAMLRDENARLNGNTAELLRLRGEVTLLRRNQAGPQIAAATPGSQAQAAVTRDSSSEDIGRELGLAVVRGEAGAFDKIKELANSAFARFKTNRAGLNDTQRGELSRQISRRWRLLST